MNINLENFNIRRTNPYLAGTTGLATGEESEFLEKVNRPTYLNLPSAPQGNIIHERQYKAFKSE